MKEPKRFNLVNIFKYIFMYIFAIFMIFPIFNVIISSFKTNDEINRVVFLPDKFNIKNYVEVFKSKAAILGFTNSIYIVLITMIISVFLCSLAGYALGRRKEKFYSFLYFFFLSAMMIPVASNMVSVYTLVDRLGLMDTRIALILIYTAASIPMGILLYTGFVKTIPKELDEAAAIDGCGYFTRYRLIIFPLLKQVAITQVIVSSLSVWNDFFMPLLLIRSDSKKTLPLAVYSFNFEHESNYGAIFAMLTVAIVPPILFFLFTQKHFYKGISAGAVKG